MTDPTDNRAREARTNDRIRFVLLGFLGGITTIAVVGALVLAAIGQEIPPLIAGIIGGGMSAFTVLLTPPRKEP